VLFLRHYDIFFIFFIFSWDGVELTCMCFEEIFKGVELLRLESGWGEKMRN